MIRKDEIQQLLHLSPEEVIEKAGKHLVTLNTIDNLHQHLAKLIFDEITENNQRGRHTSIILPVGPTGQYPILADLLIKGHVSLAKCWFFFMDEYCDDDGKVISSDHPLSFRGIAHKLFLDTVAESCKLNWEQVIFPNEDNIHTIPDLIEQVGGIDTCYGGIGIHGHIAFNEPEYGVKNLPCRKVRLNDFTVTINAIRSQIGGNLEGFPRYAYTLGMKEILNAKRIRLTCRNGIDLDWANTVLRLALFGEPADDYPMTYIRETDYIITTDHDTLQSPVYVL
jgi:glucosamine-6-phosphate deaminase